ncbi:MAG: hypothetical protein HDS58_00510 [Barnesiella sp.]|nr:hypothetical protein [Barnesiella sp.]
MQFSYFKSFISQYLFFCNLHVAGTDFLFEYSLKVLQINDVTLKRIVFFVSAATFDISVAEYQDSIG